MPKKSYIFMLTDKDRKRHIHTVEKGRVVEFLVQYEMLLEGRWVEVVRYDTSHGFAHRDLFNINGLKRKTPLFTADNNDALTFAENDIKDNWQVYKQRFLEETIS